MKEITIVLTIYEPKIRELENFKYSTEAINRFYEEKGIENPFQFLMLSDNPNISSETNDYINNNFSKIENFDYLTCEENLVRLGQVFKHIDLIKGRYVKTVDPDDFIVPEEMIRYVEEFIKNIEDGKLIVHDYRRVKGIDIHWNTIMNIEHEVFWKKQSFNPNSTYPTCIMKKIKWEDKLLIWSDDLLGYLLYDAGAELVSAEGYSPYVNLAHGGVSTTEDFHKSMRFYDDTIKFLTKASEIIDCNEENKASFIELTAKPSYWFSKQVLIDLYFNSSLSRLEKIRLANVFFGHMEKITRLKGNYKLYKLKVKIKFLLNLRFK